LKHPKGKQGESFTSKGDREGQKTTASREKERRNLSEKDWEYRG